MIRHKLQNFVNSLPISPEKNCSYYPDRLSQIQYLPFQGKIEKDNLQFFSIPVFEEPVTSSIELLATVAVNV